MDTNAKSFVPEQQLQDQPVKWYERGAVEEFLAAGADRRAQLEATLLDATERAERARISLGLHRMMVSMFVQAQHDLANVRSQAEHRAAEIILAAERDVEMILPLAARGAGDDASREEPIVEARADDEEAVDDPVIDLGATERRNDPFASLQLDGHDAWARADGDDDEGFFAFLRGSMGNTDQLEPRSE